MCSTLVRHVHDRAEITVFLPSTVLLKPVVGPPQSMCQVRLSIPIFDNTGTVFLFEVSGQVVALPGLPSTLDTLISTGRLLETGFKLVFRLRKDAVSDDVDNVLFPRYGGTILTPCSRIIHMIYDNYTWTLYNLYVLFPLSQIPLYRPIASNSPDRAVTPPTKLPLKTHTVHCDQA
jgi:hypothetical protein